MFLGLPRTGINYFKVRDAVKKACRFKDIVPIRGEGVWRRFLNKLLTIT